VLRWGRRKYRQSVNRWLGLLQVHGAGKYFDVFHFDCVVTAPIAAWVIDDERLTRNDPDAKKGVCLVLSLSRAWR
jgi:hypothetical protein